MSLVLSREQTVLGNLVIPLSWFLLLLFIFCVLSGSMNAANFTDGLDGLAASVLAWSYAGLTILILNQNHWSLNNSGLWASLLTGLCLGFWTINKFPAQVFMGDTGSLFLGAGLAVLSLVNRLEWYLLILMLVPVIEILSVILQVLSCKLSKKFLGKDLRIFKMTPFHHHLELSGIPEPKVVQYLSWTQAVINFIYFLVLFSLGLK